MLRFSKNFVWKSEEIAACDFTFWGLRVGELGRGGVCMHPELCGGAVETMSS